MHQQVHLFWSSLSAHRFYSYGAEISRLEEASRLLKATVGPRSVDVDAGRHAQSLLGHVDQILKTARRDNDFIYLQEVPPVSVLPRLQPASLVKPTLPLPVSSPLDVLNDRLGGLGPPLFGSLVPFDVHNAIRLYDDRKEEYVLREIGDQCRKLDLEELNALQAMNLPGSLEAVSNYLAESWLLELTALPQLERPAELPPSLIRNSEATRSEGGPAAIVAMLGDVAKLSVGNRRLLDEVSTVSSTQRSINLPSPARQVKVLARKQAETTASVPSMVLFDGRAPHQTRLALPYASGKALFCAHSRWRRTVMRMYGLNGTSGQVAFAS